MAADGQKVKSYSDLRGYVDVHKPGDTIQLSIVRDGKQFEVAIVLGVVE